MQQHAPWLPNFLLQQRRAFAFLLLESAHPVIFAFVTHLCNRATVEFKCAQVAFLASMVSPKVAAAAAMRALEVLGEDDPEAAAQLDYITLEPEEPAAAAAPAAEASAAEPAAPGDGGAEAAEAAEGSRPEPDSAGPEAAARPDGAPGDAGDHPFYTELKIGPSADYLHDAYKQRILQVA